MVDGVRFVMADIGMLESAPDPRPRRQLVYSKGVRVNPTRGGFLRSRFGGEALGQPVEKERCSGRGQPVHVRGAGGTPRPCEGVLFYVARDYPVHPGDWLSVLPTSRTARPDGSRIPFGPPRRSSDEHHEQAARRDPHRRPAHPEGPAGMVRVPVVTDLDGSEISLYIHAVVGVEPGPVLAMHTALHGSEWQSAEITMRVLASLDPSRMSGAVLGLPIGNPIALASRNRNTRDESDSPDLNRAFGGQETWLTDQLARAITTHLLSHATR